MHFSLYEFIWLLTNKYLHANHALLQPLCFLLFILPCLIKQIPENSNFIGIVLHSFCLLHESQRCLTDIVSVLLYKIWFSIRMNKRGYLHLGSVLADFYKTALENKSLVTNPFLKDKYSSHFWSRQKAKPRIREAICSVWEKVAYISRDFPPK